MPNEQAVVDRSLVSGDAFAGGFYAGRIRVADIVYALIVAPKDEGETEGKWNSKNNKAVIDAMSFFDGIANTKAMAAAGSKLAQWALELRVGGFADWFVPSRDELELCYRAFKPGTYKNWCTDGNNPSSVPVGYSYFPDAPAQTSTEAFRDGGADAFQEEWYWTSTRSAGTGEYAWCQTFSYGRQDNNHKDGKLRARAVRRVPI